MATRAVIVEFFFAGGCSNCAGGLALVLTGLYMLNAFFLVISELAV